MLNIALVVATDLNGAIGKDNKLPWKLAADMRHFKELTMGHPVIMGRKTYESIGKPLPGRANIVITSNSDELEMPDYKDIIFVSSPAAAILYSSIYADIYGVDTVFVIGGSQVYKELEPEAHLIYHTTVFTKVEADSWFDIDPCIWEADKMLSVKADPTDQYSFDVRRLVRIDP